MRETVEGRRRRILDVLGEHGEVKVAHLAALLNVSPVTVRRDLEALTAEGSVQRRHGMVAGPDVSTGTLPEEAAVQGTVAIIAPERHAYLGAVILGARSFLEHAGYRVVLHLTSNTPNPERHVIQEVAENGVDGLLLAPRWRTTEQEEVTSAFVQDLDLPTVLLERSAGRRLSLRSVDSVCSDHWFGVHLAVEHLTSRGHRRILLAARQDSPTARTINSAFAEIAGSHPQIDHWLTVLSSEEAAGGDGGGNAPHHVSVNHDNPRWLPELVASEGFTAVLIHSDENALVLSQRLTAAGIRMPEDCAVIAYDDVVAGLGTTPLTAVSPPKDDVGRTGAMLLSQRLRAQRSGNPWRPHRVELLPELRIRDST